MFWFCIEIYLVVCKIFNALNLDQSKILSFGRVEEEESCCMSKNFIEWRPFWNPRVLESPTSRHQQYRQEWCMNDIWTKSVEKEESYLVSKNLSVKGIQQMAAILWAVFKTMSLGMPNFVLIQDINERDECTKFEQNLLRKKKVIVCQIISSHSISSILSALLIELSQKVMNTVFLLIHAPRAMPSIDREPLFCTQFAKQKVCPIVSAVQVFWKHCGKRRNCS